MTPQQEQLFSNHLQLVETIAKAVGKHLPPCFDLDDLKQAGAIGLLQAVERYDPTRKVPFHLWASIRIRGEIIESVRGRRWRDATAEPFDAQPERGKVVPIDKAIGRKQIFARVADAIQVLPQRDQAALRIYYMEEQGLAGVGAHFNVKTLSWSSQILKRAVSNARRACRSYGLRIAA